jgi:hypothetical protein
MDNGSEASRPTLRWVALAASLVGIAVVAILFISMRGREPMVPTEAESDERADIPPIDATAPSETKTATFAMG